VDRLSAGSDSRSANAAIFFEYAWAAYGTDMHSVAVALEQQPVPRAHAQEPANLDGHGDLAFARDFSLLLHGEFLFLTLAYFSLLGILQPPKAISKAHVTVSP